VVILPPCGSTPTVGVPRLLHVCDATIGRNGALLHPFSDALKSSLENSLTNPSRAVNLGSCAEEEEARSTVMAQAVLTWEADELRAGMRKIPGYAGHLTGMRHTLGMTYGRASADALGNDTLCKQKFDSAILGHRHDGFTTAGASAAKRATSCFSLGRAWPSVRRQAPRRSDRRPTCSVQHTRTFLSRTRSTGSGQQNTSQR